MELFIDTETTGKCEFKSPHTSPAQPDIIQLACILSDENTIYTEFKTVVDPSQANPSWKMEAEAEAVHGISREMVVQTGMPTKMAMMAVSGLLGKADKLVCHNVQFDRKLIATALHRVNGSATLNLLQSSDVYCTMLRSTKFCNLPGPYGPKWPKLIELYPFLFNGETFDGAHDAMADISATRRCYYEMVRRGL